MQKSGGGGSTITQQLAKQLYSPNASSVAERILQKPIEWFIAVRLEKYYTKEEIINMYLNKFDFLYSPLVYNPLQKLISIRFPKILKPKKRLP